MPFVTGGGGKVVKLADVADEVTDFSKVTVIGEDMNRVRTVSQFVNASDNLYDGFKYYKEWSESGKLGHCLAEVCGKADDTAWLTKKLINNYTIIDIERLGKYLKPSGSYIAEKVTVALREARNVIRHLATLYFQNGGK